MRLQQIDFLIAVAETGSLRRAAQKLGISHPAITRGIRQLEEEFGLPVLQRTSRGAIVSQFGQTVLARAKSISSEIDRLRQDADQARGQFEGAISIGVAPIPMLDFLPRIIPGFTKEFPKIRVRIFDAVAPDALASIRDGSFDFYAGPSPAGAIGSEFATRHLYTTEIVVAARTGHPMAHATSLRDLLECTWMAIGPVDGPGALFMPAFQAGGFDAPHLSVHADSIAAVRGLLEASDMICLFPRHLVKILGPKISVIAVQTGLPDLPNGLVHRSDVPLTPAALRLADMVERAASSLRH